MKDVTVSFKCHSLIAGILMDLYTVMQAQSFNEVNLDSLFLILEEYRACFPTAEIDGDYKTISPRLNYDRFIRELESAADHMKRSKEYRRVYLERIGLTDN